MTQPTDRTRRALVMDEAVGILARTPATLDALLRQLMATWVAHDFDHLMQISRVLARQYSDDVGPWRAYLRIIRDSES